VTRIWPEEPLRDAERDLLAIAKFLTCVETNEQTNKQTNNRLNSMSTEMCVKHSSDVIFSDTV